MGHTADTLGLPLCFMLLLTDIFQLTSASRLHLQVQTHVQNCGETSPVCLFVCMGAKHLGQPPMTSSKTLEQQKASDASVRAQLTDVSLSHTQILHWVYHIHGVKLEQDCASLQTEFRNRNRGREKKILASRLHTSFIWIKIFNTLSL